MDSNFFNPWAFLHKVERIKWPKKKPLYQRVAFEILGRLVVLLFIPVLVLVLVVVSVFPGRAIDKFFSVLYWVASLYLKVKQS